MKIKEDKYGTTIRMLLERGGWFVTRHEWILIANSEQKKFLEEAGLIDSEGLKEEVGKDNGRKKNAH
jgi:hypothetical protein